MLIPISLSSIKDFSMNEIFDLMVMLFISVIISFGRHPEGNVWFLTWKLPFIPEYLIS